MTRRTILAWLGALFGVFSARPGSSPAAEAPLPPFEKFRRAYPPDPEVRPCTEAECQAFAGKLPEPLLRFWREVGRGSFGGGLLVLTDPGAWQDTLSAWLRGNIAGRTLIARSGFGDLFYYRDKGMQEIDGVQTRVEDVSRLDPHQPEVEVCAWSLGEFFDDYLCDPDTQETALRKPLFAAAVKRLGRPQGDDGFFFVPALALGGSAAPEHIDRGDLRVHLQILVQLHQ